jgi:hypothetical protein
MAPKLSPSVTANGLHQVLAVLDGVFGRAEFNRLRHGVGVRDGYEGPAVLGNGEAAAHDDGSSKSCAEDNFGNGHKMASLMLTPTLEAGCPDPRPSG